MLAALAIVLSTFGSSPNAEWSVNANNALIWGGRPYMPVGAYVRGDQESISRALAAGIRDLVVALPANGVGWEEASTLIEAAGARWLLAVSSTAPGAEGMVVEPGNYRIDVDGATEVDVTVPGATETLGIVADKRNSAVRFAKSFSTPEGHFGEHIDAGINTPHVLLLYPLVKDMRLPDFWEGFDAHRDQLLGSLRAHKLGSGFRGVIDPMGPIAKFPDPDTMFVPRSALFQMELAEYLESKYGSVETCIRGWSIGAHDIKSWDHLARLVPLWSVSKGVPMLWDPINEKAYVSDRTSSAAWIDIRHVIHATSLRRFSKLVSGIEQASGVPVIQSWEGWNGPYGSSATGVAGVTCRVSAKDQRDLVERTCRPASSVLQTDSGRMVFAPIVKIDPSSSLDVDQAMMELRALGARAFFFDTEDPEALKGVAQVATRMATDAGDAEWRPSALFYPEGAHNPAEPVQIQGGRWMLPSPAAGNRLDLGSWFRGYFFSGEGGEYTVLWSAVGTVKTKFYLGDPKAVTVETLYGEPVKLRTNKDSIELEVSELPLLFKGVRDVPVPQPSYEETILLLTALFGNFENLVDPSGEQRFLFADNTKAFKRNPIGSYVALRKQFDLLSVRAAPYVWIEAERSIQSSFGDIGFRPGASSGNCLLLDTKMVSDRDHSASYKFRPKRKGLYEFWISAAIPEYARKDVVLVVNGRQLQVVSGPVAEYGLGFGWYKFQSAELGEDAEIKVSIAPGALVSVALDVIVASPVPFEPIGGQPPTSFIAPPTK